MAITRTATIEDVARHAGVSRQTVSNVLNTPAIVRESTRERVRASIEKLDYAPHASARRLRTQRSSTIGLRLDAYAGGTSGVVLDRFVHALTERADEHGLRVLVYAARTPADEIARWNDLVHGGDIDAVVVSGTFHGDPRTQWLLRRGLPFVSFGRPWSDATDDRGDGGVSHEHPHPWVDVDGAAGTAAATRHALATAGPRVAFLGWPVGSGTGDDRARGWRVEIGARAGGPTAPRLMAEENVAAARDVVARLLADTRRGDLDAIVCASDSLAIGAHLAAVGAERPGLPIIGFDNTPAVAALGLSSVEQLPEAVAAGALDLLLSATGAVGAAPADPKSAHVLVQPHLVVR